ncbi:MAG: LysM peptidoglycan-binding domain-containing protein [Candidatus Nanopelagicales bacterium]
MSTYSPATIWQPTERVSEPAIQLTRRGRLARTAALLTLLAVLVLMSLDVLSGGRALAETAPPSVAVSTVTAVVAQGDSLWSIAQSVSPAADPRAVIGEIRELNGLRSNLIQPGQVLLVPAGS